jgi:MFS family permease
LSSVLLLNLANYAGWISFASVASKAADFYHVSDSRVQLIVTVSYALGTPCCAAATYVFARGGLRPALLIGAALTLIGALLVCLSTLPGFREAVPQASWYWMALAGQAITGVASPFVASVPAKVSQHWFPENQRPAATAVLGMSDDHPFPLSYSKLNQNVSIIFRLKLSGLSNPVGLVIGQSLTPLLVRSAADIPLMNAVWLVPAAAGAALTFLGVTASSRRRRPAAVQPWRADKKSAHSPPH